MQSIMQTQNATATHPHADTPGDDAVRINQSTLIALNRDARQLPLKSASIRAQFNGQYLSSFKGRGMEFDEARPYQPGDDIRAMDWRVTARTGKAHSKVFREERERPVLLWVDYRQPMFFGTQQHFKSVLAAKIAALLAWSTAHHGDRLGGLIFSSQADSNAHIELRPSRGKSASLHFIKQLAQHPAWNTQNNTSEAIAAENEPLSHASSATQSLSRLQRVSKPGSLIFLISDFRNMDDKAWSGLTQLGRHSDVVLISIHDPLESQLPPAGIYKISDGAREINLNTYNKRQRQQYHQRYEMQQSQLQSRCRKQGMQYINVSTADDYLYVLQQGLGLASGTKRKK
ncbi:hypothetical protein PA3071 [hydrothermal vent metagenome]|uniref:DUF58 domain-containing protein n=1 Tax=hydrothermal vent metagenome TaxID=652676 RepID=A0A3B0WZE5_9ZZZZ